jgi:hypothetical protein
MRTQMRHLLQQKMTKQKTCFRLFNKVFRTEAVQHRTVGSLTNWKHLQRSGRGLHKVQAYNFPEGAETNQEITRPRSEPSIAPAQSTALTLGTLCAVRNS